MGVPSLRFGQPAGALRAEPLDGVSGVAAHQAQGRLSIPLPLASGPLRERACRAECD